MEKSCLLACLPWGAQPAFLSIPRPHTIFFSRLSEPSCINQSRKRPHKLAYRPIWWMQLLKVGSLFPSDSNLFQVDRTNQSTTQYIYIYWDGISLCSPDWPWTSKPLVSDSLMLGSMLSFTNSFICENIYIRNYPDWDSKHRPGVCPCRPIPRLTSSELWSRLTPLCSVPTESILPFPSVSTSVHHPLAFPGVSLSSFISLKICCLALPTDFWN